MNFIVSVLSQEIKIYIWLCCFLYKCECLLQRTQKKNDPKKSHCGSNFKIFLSLRCLNSSSKSSSCIGVLARNLLISSRSSCRLDSSLWDSSSSKVTVPTRRYKNVETTRARVRKFCRLIEKLSFSMFKILLVSMVVLIFLRLFILNTLPVSAVGVVGYLISDFL